MIVGGSMTVAAFSTLFFTTVFVVDSPVLATAPVPFVPSIDVAAVLNAYVTQRDLEYAISLHHIPFKRIFYRFGYIFERIDWMDHCMDKTLNRLHGLVTKSYNFVTKSFPAS
jgi:hypothetical protein